MPQYPKYKYHAELEPEIVHDEAAEAALGAGWEDSPADHGVITNPSKEQALQMRQEALVKEQKRGPGRPKKDE